MSTISDSAVNTAPKQVIRINNKGLNLLLMALADDGEIDAIELRLLEKIQELKKRKHELEFIETILVMISLGKILIIKFVTAIPVMNTEEES
jgi:hypothetical protein